MSETLKLTIAGRPATKKTHGQIIMLGKNPYIEIVKGKKVIRGAFPTMIPSKTFVTYEKDCLKQFRTMPEIEKVPGWVHVIALYWLPNKAHWPDLIGLKQATGDILEKAGLIDNDKFIAHWDGSRIAGIDKNNPRADIIITSLPDWEEQLFGEVQLKQGGLF